MKQTGRLITGLLLLLLCSSWGFYAHHRINRLAVFTLPKGMARFYKSNIDYITEHAISADKRRYVDSTEAPRHFFDADHYGKHPFSTIPHNYFDAAKKYSADTMAKYGTVPWVIAQNYYRLVRAFKAHDTTGILNSSANIGHYIADAHVPLHLTLNYDGQLTGQTGLHAFWESRLPELFADHYHLYAGKARYIDNPLTEAFKICRSSYSSVDSVILFERLLNKRFTADEKYCIIRVNNKNVKAYSITYSAAYQKMLRGMVEKRMRTAILSVGSFWYSAWVDAGQPDLDRLIKTPLNADDMHKIQKEEAIFRSAKL